MYRLLPSFSCYGKLLVCGYSSGFHLSWVFLFSLPLLLMFLLLLLLSLLLLRAVIFVVEDSCNCITFVFSSWYLSQRK